MTTAERTLAAGLERYLAGGGVEALADAIQAMIRAEAEDHYGASRRLDAWRDRCERARTIVADPTTIHDAITDGAP